MFMKSFRALTICIATVILLILLTCWGRDTNWSYIYGGINRNELFNNKWKSLYGDYLGDWLIFDSSNLDADYNIVKKGKKVGRVINATSGRLTVMTLDGKRGYYCAK